jgi:uncharacterized repeat protein (TIGR03803 family)
MTKLNAWRKICAAFVLCAATAIGSPAQTFTYDNLYSFTNDGPGGAEPVAGLILDKAGNLYGTTFSGGAHHQGTVFKLTPSPDGKWIETVLHSFSGSDGSSPTAGLVFDQEGNLYGTTWNGGPLAAGNVFELTPDSKGNWTENDIFLFCALSKCADGANPGASLIFDQAGNLYGTTATGGSTLCTGGCGTVFKLTPLPHGGWTHSVLYTFCGTGDCGGGERPRASLILDQAGNLYGTAELGGHCEPPGCGVVFELTHASGGWAEKVLYTFCSLSGCADGQLPLGSLIFDQAGNLYGTTVLGGKNGDGLVFQLTPNSNGAWTETVLHSFAGTDGYAPDANLILDGAGNLYGTTSEGGGGGAGVVFVLVPNKTGRWEYIILHNFFDNPGALPEAGVVMDSAGNLYGTTTGDSNQTFGSVFEVTP